MGEATKTVQELAKTTGKAIDGLRDFGGFIAKYTGGSLEQAFGIIEDKLAYMRWERQVRLMKRADEFLKERGLDCPTRPVLMKIAIPLLQAASLEEDDQLQDLWAHMLANAADAESGIEVRRAFIRMLEDMESFDALILEKIIHAPRGVFGASVWVKYLPDEVVISQKGLESTEPSPEVSIAVANLARLGLVEGNRIYEQIGSPHNVGATEFGREFYKACTTPRSKAASAED